MARTPRGQIDPTDEFYGLQEIPLPDVAMQIVGADQAVAEVQLPAGDYALVASVLVSENTVQQFYSQPERLQLDVATHQPPASRSGLRPSTMTPA